MKATGKPSTTKSQSLVKRNSEAKATGGKAVGKTTVPGANRSDQAGANGRRATKPPVGKPEVTKPTKPDGPPATGKPDASSQGARPRPPPDGKAKQPATDTATATPPEKTKTEPAGPQNAAEPAATSPSRAFLTYPPFEGG